jgi:hypothetical protein
MSLMRARINPSDKQWYSSISVSPMGLFFLSGGGSREAHRLGAERSQQSSTNSALSSIDPLCHGPRPVLRGFLLFWSPITWAVSPTLSLVRRRAHRSKACFFSGA